MNEKHLRGNDTNATPDCRRGIIGDGSLIVNTEQRLVAALAAMQATLHRVLQIRQSQTSTRRNLTGKIKIVVLD